MPSLRDLGNAALYRLQRILVRLQLLLQLDLGLVKQYQPNPFSSTQPEGQSARSCIDRFNSFSALLPSDEPLCTLDIGCNLGYFTFRMSERGGMCIGLDLGRNEISVARALAARHRVPNVAFCQYEVTADSAAALPAVDVVICLSVFHHWVRKFGFSEARRVMEVVAARATRYLVFETGQHDETGVAWADDLAFMGGDCDAWIQMFLKDLGFRRVHHVGRFPTSVSPVARHLYVAMRDSAG